jgi:pimeloyl-ACP methyl ester carboxylesterase
VVEPLTAARRVVLVDQLGHGASPRVDRYDFEVLTAALVEFLEREFAGPVDLLGHSMGGRTVLPIAIDRPDLVRSLIMMDTWADQADRGVDAEFFAAAFARPRDEAFAALDEFWAEPTPERRLVLDRWGEAWVEAHYDDNAARVDPEARYQLGRLIFVPSPGELDRCGSIDCPTTVICGEHDAAYLDAARRLAAAIPDARLDFIPGAYHSPQLTHPEAWLAAVTAHLEWVS